MDIRIVPFAQILCVEQPRGPQDGWELIIYFFGLNSCGKKRKGLASRQASLHKLVTINL